MHMVTEEKPVLQMLAKAVTDIFFKQSSRIAFPSAALVFEFEKLECQMMGKGVTTVWVLVKGLEVCARLKVGFFKGDNWTRTLPKYW